MLANYHKEVANGLRFLSKMRSDGRAGETLDRQRGAELIMGRLQPDGRPLMTSVCGKPDESQMTEDLYCLCLE